MRDLPSIEITGEVPFTEEGLFGRLRNVSLRGFPHVKIYKRAEFETEFVPASQIPLRIHTPQLRVYKKPNLERIAKLNALFLNKEVDILDLDRGYDYLFTDENGEESNWTILPPVVERFSIPRDEEGRLNYLPLIGEELANSLRNKNLGLNPELGDLRATSQDDTYDLINDGSHRVHFGFMNRGVRILKISGMTPGFPYYAAPQKYNITVFGNRDEALDLPETKVHIVDAPAHKDLYRLFPSGGIMSGDVRSDKKLSQ
jgi:hypothetical protein